MSAGPGDRKGRHCAQEGEASVVIGAGIKILTDPWFSERPGYLRGEPLAYTPESLPHLDGVLVSHSHYDHFDMQAFQAYRC